MQTDTIFSVSSHYFLLNKVGCSDLGLAENPVQGSQQTNEWKIWQQLLNSGCTKENRLVFNRRLILICTAVFFNAFVVSLLAGLLAGSWVAAGVGHR